MLNLPPGFRPARLVNLMSQAIQRCQLQLDQAVILTEAATGAYAVTPVLAAMAGATKVFAIARETRYGTIAQVESTLRELAEIAGVTDRIEVIEHKSQEVVQQADIITNSGHVRPIDTEMIGWMKSTAVIALMYEAWEFRPEDVALAACRQKGIPLVGVNERHPAVDVFSFLGIMAVKLLLDAGVSVYSSHLLLLCDNDFRPFIERGLINAGAEVECVDQLAIASFSRSYDAIIVALKPGTEQVFTRADAELVAQKSPESLVMQYWGDIDRAALESHHISVCPDVEPKPGHMGILPSAVGPEPIIRLQTGGLKAAEVIWRQLSATDPALNFAQLVQADP